MHGSAITNRRRTTTTKPVENINTKLNCSGHIGISQSVERIFLKVHEAFTEPPNVCFYTKIGTVPYLAEHIAVLSES